MRHRRGFKFRYGFMPPFGFYFRSAWHFPRRQEYLTMLEEHKAELEEELREVEREIEWAKSGSPPPEEEKG
jgi:hypothetical protein